LFQVACFVFFSGNRASGSKNKMVADSALFPSYLRFLFSSDERIPKFCLAFHPRASKHPYPRKINKQTNKQTKREQNQSK